MSNGTINIERVYFSISMLIRFVYSCLVDADFLDTERFMKNETRRKMCSSDFEEYQATLMEYVKTKHWLENTDLQSLNGRRANILKNCIDSGQTAKRDIYTLTVPTGGGKTISSLAFAVHQARAQEMKRVIYVIPYTSILEQTVTIFKEIFGEEKVLAHYSGGDYFSPGERSEELNYKELASENWDIPIVVTTDVQFFESMFASKSSKCRKLHNIADSVVIFDEVQLIPRNNLIPCMYAIEELVRIFHCSVVLCSATQPDYFEGTRLFTRAPKEIANNIQEEFQAFRKVIYRYLPNQSLDSLADRLNKTDNALVVLNKKSTVYKLFKKLEGEGVYYLTTNLTPNDRKEILKNIKERLDNNQKCIVIATSLVEAGVDLDFHTVYREIAGLESIIQAAGRGNRENKRKREDSIVYIIDWSAESGLASQDFKQKAGICRRIIAKNSDLESPELIKEYFKVLNKLADNSMLDQHGVFDCFNKSDLKFKKCSKEFRMIDQQSKSVVIPSDPVINQWIKEIDSNEWIGNRQIIRKLMNYSVTVNERDLQNLLQRGVVKQVLGLNDLYVLTEEGLYDSKTGLMVK